jgi:heme/flavin dehydrogenase (mycofactocin system)
MANAWFESVAEAQRRAQKRLPGPVYSALMAGSERGDSYADNTTAFSKIGFAPHIAGLSGKRDLATSVMGQQISMPVIISPTGVQAVHPDGEVAVARAAAARGTVFSLSSFGSKPMEEVVAANPQTFFQVYWLGSREAMTARLERAKAAGVVGIIVTLDWSWSHSRDWGSPSIPSSVDLKTLVSFSPHAIRRPRWAYQFVSAGIPDLSTPNINPKDSPQPGFFEAYGEWMQTPPPSWEDIAWLRSQWDGPFMIKGICRVDDARQAVATGATTISVSNHGGNNLDGTPAPIRVLPSIVAAVGDQIEIVLDGGIRRGSDVVKAVALGARAVMIGRAYLWGLAANGQAGVENVLDVLRNGIDSAVYSLGHSSIHDLSPSDVLVPEGFTQVLGGESVQGTT